MNKYNQITKDNLNKALNILSEYFKQETGNTKIKIGLVVIEPKHNKTLSDIHYIANVDKRTMSSIWHDLIIKWSNKKSIKNTEIH